MRCRLRYAGCLLPCLVLLACRPLQIDDSARYRAWQRDANAVHAARYLQVLQANDVGDVVLLPALLRSSRRWQACSAPEFSVPPDERMRAIVPTLRVIARLHREGIVRTELARSSYRDEALNRCSGGSARSRHVVNNAIDFDLPADGDRVARLCRFWRTEGPGLNLGLGFYTSSTIHIDTSGHRTWGKDHRRGSSLCLQTAQSP